MKRVREEVEEIPTSEEGDLKRLKETLQIGIPEANKLGTRALSEGRTPANTPIANKGVKFNEARSSTEQDAQKVGGTSGSNYSPVMSRPALGAAGAGQNTVIPGGSLGLPTGGLRSTVGTPQAGAGTPAGSTPSSGTPIVHGTFITGTVPGTTTFGGATSSTSAAFPVYESSDNSFTSGIAQSNGASNLGGFGYTSGEFGDTSGKSSGGFGGTKPGSNLGGFGGSTSTGSDPFPSNKSGGFLTSLGFDSDFGISSYNKDKPGGFAALVKSENGFASGGFTAGGFVAGGFRGAGASTSGGFGGTSESNSGRFGGTSNAGVANGANATAGPNGTISNAGFGVGLGGGQTIFGTNALKSSPQFGKRELKVDSPFDASSQQNQFESIKGTSVGDVTAQGIVRESHATWKQVDSTKDPVSLSEALRVARQLVGKGKKKKGLLRHNSSSDPPDVLLATKSTSSRFAPIPEEWSSQMDVSPEKEKRPPLSMDGPPLSMDSPLETQTAETQTSLTNAMGVVNMNSQRLSETQDMLETQGKSQAMDSDEGAIPRQNSKDRSPMGLFRRDGPMGVAPNMRNLPAGAPSPQDDENMDESEGDNSCSDGRLDRSTAIRRNVSAASSDVESAEMPDVLLHTDYCKLYQFMRSNTDNPSPTEDPNAAGASQEGSTTNTASAALSQNSNPPETVAKQGWKLRAETAVMRLTLSRESKSLNVVVRMRGTLKVLIHTPILGFPKSIEKVGNNSMTFFAQTLQGEPGLFRLNLLAQQKRDTLFEVLMEVGKILAQGNGK